MRFAWGVSRILVPPTGASAPARISARRGTSRDGFFLNTCFPGLIFFRTTLVFVRRSGFFEFLVFFLKIFAIFEWDGKFRGHVSFIRDSGEDIFFEAVLKFFEIFELGGNFLGHVSFMRDSGWDIFFRGRFGKF